MVTLCESGAFWLAMGITLTPAYDASGYYTPANGGAAEFNATFGMQIPSWIHSTLVGSFVQRPQKSVPVLTTRFIAFFHMCMALVTFFFCVGSIRTNLVLWLVFVFIDLAFIMLMATYWTLAEGMTTTAGNLQIVSQTPAALPITRELTFKLATGGRSLRLRLLRSRLVSVFASDPNSCGSAHSPGI